MSADCGGREHASTQLLRQPATELTLETQCATTGCAMKVQSRAVSSAGRASRLHREGRRFESVTAHHENQMLRRDNVPDTVEPHTPLYRRPFVSQ
jgi:hypothetical protein